MDEYEKIETVGSPKELFKDELNYGAIMKYLLDFYYFEHILAFNDFRNELIYKNRFLPSLELYEKIIDPLIKNKDRATYIVNKNDKKNKFFRARIYEPNFAKLMREALNFSDIDKKTKADLYNLFKNININNEQNEIFIISSQIESLLTPEQASAYKQFLKRKKFQGYDKANSGAPPADSVAEGRVNPAKIKYLYIAEHVDTAIYEVKPILNQNVSVATMKAKEDLQLFDFSISIEEKSNSDTPRASMFDTIGNFFSIPNHGNKEDYLPTQYIAECIKNIEQPKFDGIRFRSSLHKDGINILLFNPDKCEAISSNVYNIRDINISSEIM